MKGQTVSWIYDVSRECSEHECAKSGMGSRKIQD
jgi:hypothetical protein